MNTALHMTFPSVTQSRNVTLRLIQSLIQLTLRNARTLLLNTARRLTHRSVILLLLWDTMLDMGGMEVMDMEVMEDMKAMEVMEDLEVTIMESVKPQLMVDMVGIMWVIHLHIARLIQRSNVTRFQSKLHDMFPAKFASLEKFVFLMWSLSVFHHPGQSPRWDATQFRSQFQEKSVILFTGRNVIQSTSRCLGKSALILTHKLKFILRHMLIILLL